jgi:hypothetical protein
MSVKIFLSAVSDEFRRYRDLLRHDLTRHNVEVKVQEDFKDLSGETLDKLDVYIAHCDAVVHLVGDMTGAYPRERGLGALLAKYPNLPAKLPPLDAPLSSAATQLALRSGGGSACPSSTGFSIDGCNVSPRFFITRSVARSGPSFARQRRTGVDPEPTAQTGW